MAISEIDRLLGKRDRNPTVVVARSRRRVHSTGPVAPEARRAMGIRQTEKLKRQMERNPPVGVRFSQPGEVSS